MVFDHIAVRSFVHSNLLRETRRKVLSLKAFLLDPEWLPVLQT